MYNYLFFLSCMTFLRISDTETQTTQDLDFSFKKSCRFFRDSGTDDPHSDTDMHRVRAIDSTTLERNFVRPNFRPLFQVAHEAVKRATELPTGARTVGLAQPAQPVVVYSRGRRDSVRLENHPFFEKKTH